MPSFLNEWVKGKNNLKDVFHYFPVGRQLSLFFLEASVFELIYSIKDEQTYFSEHQKAL